MGVGEGVVLGVGVEVAVGARVRDGVGVGPVGVGNGPKRACEVSAMAVRVLFARANSSRPERDGWISA